MTIIQCMNSITVKLSEGEGCFFVSSEVQDIIMEKNKMLSSSKWEHYNLWIMRSVGRGAELTFSLKSILYLQDDEV